MKKLLTLLILLSVSYSNFATHYVNKTGKTIVITNVTEKKRQHRKNMWSWGGSYGKKHKTAGRVDDTMHIDEALYMITIEKDSEGDLANRQDDEIRITSPGFSDHRKLFPTNNSFNYVITMNKYKNKYERFDINHAGQLPVDKSSKKKNKVKKDNP